MAYRVICEVCGKVDKPANTYKVRAVTNSNIKVHNTYLVDIDICGDCKDKLLEQIKKARESLDAN